MSSRTAALPVEPAPQQLALAARSCSILTAASTLAEWVGTGRPVTTRGVLKPAAAVEACDLLGIELSSRKPRSALDISSLMVAWTAAGIAGFIEVDRARAAARPPLRSWLGGTPEEVLVIWARCAAEFLGLAGEGGETDLDALVVLAFLHQREDAVSLDELDEAVLQYLDGGAPDCSCPDCTSLPADLAGMEAVENIVAVLNEFGMVVLREDTAELTPLARWFTDVMFRQSAPSADVDAGTLVNVLSGLPDTVASLMCRPWLAARAPVAAARELLAFGQAASGPLRLTAFSLARECGPDAAPAWQELATLKGAGAYARVWLAEQENAEPAEADLTWIFVDTVSSMLDAMPDGLPPDLVSALLQAQGDAELAEVLPLLGDCDHPGAARLVTLLTAHLANPFPGLGVPGLGMAPLSRPVLPERPERADARFRIKVQLRGVTKPPVWRRMEVPAALSLDRLHGVIQAAMGWGDSHMHAFSDGQYEYGLPDPELGHHDEREVYLSQLLGGAGDRIQYAYDFGDGWEHDIVLERILPADPGVTGALCTGGKGACPPEDCGGIWGYEQLKDTLADPAAEEHDTLLDWLGLKSGADFDAGEFSVEEVNQRLAHGASARR